MPNTPVALNSVRQVMASSATPIRFCERRASAYKSADGLDLPVAFKVASGMNPT
jgi:hypothetical protein